MRVRYLAPLLAALAAALASGPALAGGKGFGGQKGQSFGGAKHGGSGFHHRGGHHHHGHRHHHHHSSIGVGFAFGSPWWYPPPYYYYPVAYPAQPATYVEQNGAVSEEPAGWWYYCAPANGYYPHVKECPSGWQRVPASPSD
jgi:hypothetical protein